MVDKKSKGTIGAPKRGLRTIFTETLEKLHLIEAGGSQLPGFQSGVDSDEWKWRRLSQSNKDLPASTFDRMQKLAYYMYLNNPLAGSILEMTKNFIVGDGVKISAEEKEVEKILMDFWADPDNAWDIRFDKRVIDLLMSGEWLFSTNVEKTLGRVKLGFIDPQQIKKVNMLLTNTEQYDSIEICYPTVVGITGNKTLSVAKRDKNPKSDTFGRLSGECLFYPINNVSGMTRGVSDIYSLIDWLDGFDQFLFSRLERAKLVNSFVWDLLMKGMSQPEINKWVNENMTEAPMPGSIKAHNENVELNIVTPQFGANDVKEELRMIRQQILTRAGYPEHWFTEGRSTNRATAIEMGLPTLKKLQAKQRVLKYILEDMLRYVLDQAIIAGQLKGIAEEKRKFSVDFPKISEEDISLVASTLNVAAGALMVGVQSGWITNDQARKVYLFLINRTGLETKEATEQELAKAAEELKSKQQAQLPPGVQVPQKEQAPPMGSEQAKAIVETYIKVMDGELKNKTCPLINI